MSPLGVGILTHGLDADKHMPNITHITFNSHKSYTAHGTITKKKEQLEYSSSQARI
jgi:hypothetical protein